MSNFEPLSVIINPPPSNVLQIYPGESSELSVVVTNSDPEGIVVEVYLDIPERIRSWCKLSRTSFSLDTGRSQSVEFQWVIPTEAIPNRYRYDLVVDSPRLTAPLLSTLEIEVLTPIQTSININDPTFTLQPLTSSTHPLELTTKSVTLQVLIHNRSNLVDDFRLTCPDLDDNWYTVQYPEGLQKQGVIEGGSKLRLNPNQQDQITLLLHPPENTFAGHYRPTIRLHSTVKPDLLLQSIFYLHISPIYQLDLTLQTVKERVRESSALYQLVIKNNGNTLREIRLITGTGNEDDICQYQIDSTPLKIPPGKTIAMGLKVKPSKRARRHFWGGAKPINFQVTLEDLNQLPLPTYLPLKGVLLWEARPWWQLFLLILSGVLGVCSLGFVIWWFLIKPPLLPKIASVEPTENSYDFGEDIKLNWEIEHPKRLKSIKIIGKNSQGEQVIEPIIFNAKDLQENPNCKILPQDKLVCKNMTTGAKAPKDYQFSLNVLAQKRWGTEETQKDTNLIKIEAPQSPIVSNVGSPQNQYTLPQKVDLTFDIAYPQQASTVKILQNNITLYSIAPVDLPDVCKEIDKNNLSCHIQFPISKPGEYILSVQAIPNDQILPYVQPQEAVPLQKSVIIEDKKVPLKINLFSINDEIISPIKIKKNQNAVVKWDVTGKDVKVTFDGVSQEFGPKEQHTFTYEYLTQKVPPDKPQFRVSMRVKDAYGNTDNRELLVQVELPKPPEPTPSTSPSPSPNSSPETPPKSPNSKSDDWSL